MNQTVEIFKPGIAELKTLAEKFKGLEIKGVEDEAGYIQVKDARKELGDMRILITKTGKSAREEARKYASSVIEQEKEYLQVITPLENELKAKIEAIDKAKKKAERMILLPSRKAMLAEIGSNMTDDEILELDENEFSKIYTDQKMAHLEDKERKRKEKEDAKIRKEEIEKARIESAKRATEEAEKKAKEDLERLEKDKQAEIDKLKSDQEEKERKDNQEKEDKIAQEKADQEKAEKSRKLKAFLKKNGCEFFPKTIVADKNLRENDDFIAKRDGETFTLYKKVDSIIIK